MEDSFVGSLKEKLSEDREYYLVIKQFVDELSTKYKTNIKNIMELIRGHIGVTYDKDQGTISNIRFRDKLSDEELESLMISLSVEMYFVNSIMDNKYLDMELGEHLKNFCIADKIINLIAQKKGSEKERIKIAEYQAMTAIVAQVIKSRVLFNLKNEIDAANRVLEALKKVVTNRIEDKKIHIKTGQ